MNIPCNITMCDNNTGNFEKLCMFGIDAKLIKYAKSEKEMCPDLRKKILELEKEFNKCFAERIVERLEEFEDEAKQFGVSGMLADMLEIVKEEGGIDGSNL